MATVSTNVLTDSDLQMGHPPSLFILFFTEMWERFSYYGLRPLLVLFMSAALIDGGFGFDRGQASAIVGIYGALVYLQFLDEQTSVDALASRAHMSPRTFARRVHAAPPLVDT